MTGIIDVERIGNYYRVTPILHIAKNRRVRCINRLFEMLEEHGMLWPEPAYFRYLRRLEKIGLKRG